MMFTFCSDSTNLNIYLQIDQKMKKSRSIGLLNGIFYLIKFTIQTSAEMYVPLAKLILAI